MLFFSFIAGEEETKFLIVHLKLWFPSCVVLRILRDFDSYWQGIITLIMPQFTENYSFTDI